MTKERDRRIPVELSCWIEGDDGATCVPTFDLSDRGVSVQSDDPLPEGRVIRVQFFTPLAAEAVTVEARVVWSRTEPDGGMGLTFLNIDEKTQGVLRETARLIRMRKQAEERHCEPAD